MEIKNQYRTLTENASTLDLFDNWEQIDNLEEFSQEKSDQRYLDIENYIDFSNKEKVISFQDNQIEYLAYAALISQAFFFDIRSFDLENNSPEKQNLSSILLSVARTLSIDSVLRFNTNKEFFRSFTRFTRKCNLIIYLLVNRQKQKQNCERKRRNLGIVILSHQGQVLHILSNVQQDSEKLNKILKKHFHRLNLIVVLDKCPQIQQSKKITSQLMECNKNFVYISPKTQEVLSWMTQNPESDKIGLNTRARSECFLNNNFLIRQLEHSQIDNFQHNVFKALELQKVYDFVLQNFYRADKFNEDTHFSNVFINSVIAWSYNMVLKLWSKQLCSQDPRQTVTMLSNNLAETFIKSIKKYDSEQKYIIQQKYSKNCFPSLLQNSKACVVCKQRKPKYGCSKCTFKFKKEINLCVYPCFKKFHENKLKYVSKKLIPNSFQSMLIPQSSKHALKNIEKTMQFKSKEIKQSTLSSQSLKDSKYHKQISNSKTIRKKVKKIEKKHNITPTIIKGARLYSFLPSRESIDQQTESEIELEQELSEDSFEEQKPADYHYQQLSTDSIKK